MVDRIELQSASNPGSVVGGGSSGLPIVAQLSQVSTCFDKADDLHINADAVLFIFFNLAVIFDEKIMLVDVYLDTRSPSVELLKCFGAVLFTFISQSIPGP